MMTEQTALPIAGMAPATSRLAPNAISVAQDTLIGLADTGPTVSVSFSLVLLIAATAYAAPLVLAITAIPMLIIANAYRRLNLWNANCGASFEWVGRAINPYLGYMTGWLMLAGTLFGTLTPVTAVGPSVLAVFNSPANSRWPNIAIATGLILVMTIRSECSPERCSALSLRSPRLARPSSRSLTLRPTAGGRTSPLPPASSW